MLCENPRNLRAKSTSTHTEPEIKKPATPTLCENPRDLRAIYLHEIVSIPRNDVPIKI